MVSTSASSGLNSTVRREGWHTWGLVSTPDAQGTQHCVWPLAILSELKTGTSTFSSGREWFPPQHCCQTYKIHLCFHEILPECAFRMNEVP